MPLSSAAFGLAPWCSSIDASTARPARTASSRGVRFRLSLCSMFAPSRMRALHTSNRFRVVHFQLYIHAVRCTHCESVSHEPTSHMSHMSHMSRTIWTISKQSWHAIQRLRQYKHTNFEKTCNTNEDRFFRLSAKFALASSMHDSNILTGHRRCGHAQRPE